MPPADAVLELVLERVQARLDGQFRDSDALDAKALGVLGADAAALGVLIAAHDGINAYWWIPGIVLGTAGLLLLAAIWPRRLDSGPNWRLFYERYGGGEGGEVGRQMLAELLAAVEQNDAQADRRYGKNTLFKTGFALMIIGLIGAAVVGLLR